MTVSTLQQYLQSLAVALRGSGAAQKVIDDLEATSRQLEPLKEFDFGKLAEFLAKVNAAYENNLPLPKARGSRTRTPVTPPDAEKVKGLAMRVQELRDRAMNPDASPDDVTSLLQQLEAEMNKEEAVAVAREIGVTGNLRSKQDAMNEIRNKILERQPAMM
jgi:multidrug resistance efflux pump